MGRAARRRRPRRPRARLAARRDEPPSRCSARTALLTLEVGHDAGGGATFVRWPDALIVYRARIGGRDRFARPAAGWADRDVVGLAPDDVLTLRIPGVVDAHRADGSWVGADGPVDGPTVARVVAELARLRAAGVVGERSVDWDGPVVTLGAADRDVTLTLGHSRGRSRALTGRRLPPGRALARRNRASRDVS
ncbi:MAG: hypothetical protein R3F59_34925 [Myxococcota bacterium]